jgi:hypothetical protein
MNGDEDVCLKSFQPVSEYDVIPRSFGRIWGFPVHVLPRQAARAAWKINYQQAINAAHCCLVASCVIPDVHRVRLSDRRGGVGASP